MMVDYIYYLDLEKQIEKLEGELAASKADALRRVSLLEESESVLKRQRDNAWSEVAKLNRQNAMLCETEREACKQVALTVASLVQSDGTQWERGWFEAATRVAEDIEERK